MWAPNITVAATTDSRDHDRGRANSDRGTSRPSAFAELRLVIGSRQPRQGNSTWRWVIHLVSAMSARCPVYPRCCFNDNKLPSGSLNQATFAPDGAVQMPSAFCCIKG